MGVPFPVSELRQTEDTCPYASVWCLGQTCFVCGTKKIVGRYIHISLLNSLVFAFINIGFL